MAYSNRAKHGELLVDALGEFVIGELHEASIINASDVRAKEDVAVAPETRPLAVEERDRGHHHRVTRAPRGVERHEDARTVIRAVRCRRAAQTNVTMAALAAVTSRSASERWIKGAKERTNDGSGRREDHSIGRGRRASGIDFERIAPRWRASDRGHRDAATNDDASLDELQD